MSHSITIELPDTLYERLRKWTEAAHCSPAEYVSRALENSLPDVSPDLPKELQTALWGLRNESDDNLKALANGYLPESLQEELHRLIQQRTRGESSSEDQRRIEELVTLGSEMTLKKGWARLILKDRGIVLPAG